jgi:2-hydroxychromene-2-carboxylate isomerase
MIYVETVIEYEGSAGFLPIPVSMGDLIQLSERIADRSRPTRELARFFFALDDPLSYLAAERVERALGPIEWVPVLGPLSEHPGAEPLADREQLMRERMRLAEREAAALDLPLVEPPRFPMDIRKAARVAMFALDASTGATFSMAIMRLAFCGGFDIGSTPVIVEAAAIAGLDPDAAIKVARDQCLDLRLDATSRGLGLRGVKSLPAISIGTHWFDGPNAVIAALAFSAAHGLMEAPVLPAS